jgi:hypothetical protein
MRLTDRDAASRYRIFSIGLDSRTWRFQRLQSLVVCNFQNVTFLGVRHFEHISTASNARALIALTIRTSRSRTPSTLTNSPKLSTQTLSSHPPDL